MNQATIIIVDDNVPWCQEIGKRLQRESYVVEIAHDGATAREKLSSRSFDLLILDLGLPDSPGQDSVLPESHQKKEFRDTTGAKILTELRKMNNSIFVLVVTTRTEATERIAALNDGADDYLTKVSPFLKDEIVARVGALLRRSHILRVDDLELDRLKRRVTRAGRLIELTSKEFILLEYFMRHVGEEITRNKLLEDIWSFSVDDETNTVDVHINRLRKKIDEAASIRLLSTVRGLGFRFGQK
ncbi:MAG TPA: response regulator transcription factor [Candidatus Angelobacter sp.]